MTSMRESPYYENPRRLADVIAALQAMANYDKASLAVTDWGNRLGDPASAPDWKTIFADHPEFFRVGTNPTDSSQYALLRWRHAYDRTYDPIAKRELSLAERQALDEAGQRRLTGKPLAADQLEALMKTAVELHTRAIAHAQENRWLTPLLFGLLGTILGALLKR
jgi:hypothetical protein